MRRDVERPQRCDLAGARDVAADVDRMAPDTHDSAGRGERRCQARQPDRPLLAPNLKIDVNDIVVRHGEPGQPVPNVERPDLVERLEVPDDRHATRRLRDSERPWREIRQFLGGAVRRVLLVVLGDGDAVDRLAGAEWDVAVAEREAASECDGDRLVDDDPAVGLDRDPNGCIGQGERLRSRR